jgi:hypothetical protein
MFRSVQLACSLSEKPLKIKGAEPGINSWLMIYRWLHRVQERSEGGDFTQIRPARQGLFLSKNNSLRPPRGVAPARRPGA